MPPLRITLALVLWPWVVIFYLPGWALATVLAVLAWAAWPQRAQARARWRR
jgi:uncharacterized membrane protein YedE/YeeE